MEELTLVSGLEDNLERRNWRQEDPSKSNENPGKEMKMD